MSTWMAKLKDALFEPDSLEEQDMDATMTDVDMDSGFDEEYEEEETEDVNAFKNRRSKVVSMEKQPNLTAVNGAGTMKMILFQPLSFEDSTAIVDNLRARKPVIVNMVDLERDLAQRVIDFMSGAVYALSGTIRRVSYGIFVIVPSNITIIGDTIEEVREHSGEREREMFRG